MIQPTPYISLVLIRKQLFYDWLHEANQKAMIDDDNFFKGDHSTYLVQHINTPSELEAFLKKYHLQLFANELSQWHEQEMWPVELSQALFEQWFDVHVNREVFIANGN